MKSLNDTFNIENVERINGEVITQTGEVVVPETSHVDEKIEYDYDKTRNNLHTLLSQGQEALMHALDVAKQSEHPRAFEVVGNLMKQLADVNHQLLDLSEKRQKLVAREQSKEGPKTVNNNAFFVGSTNELNKLINSMNKGD
jgi:uncharacterized protein (DUF3084 family)